MKSKMNSNETKIVNTFWISLLIRDVTILLGYFYLNRDFFFNQIINSFSTLALFGLFCIIHVIYSGVLFSVVSGNYRTRFLLVTISIVEITWNLSQIEYLLSRIG